MPQTPPPDVRISPLEGDDANRASRVEVDVIPTERPDLKVTFEYVSVPGELLGPFGLRVGQRRPVRMGSGWKLADQPERLGVAVLRDLPVARWERAARLAAQVNRSASVEWGWQGDANSDTVAADAERVVRELYPDVDPSSGKAGARTWAKLNRHAQVTLQWQRGQLAGDPDPVGTVAADRGVSPATVRSWLHRAKLDGITPESVSTALTEKPSR
ncbi:hypothetical protein A6E92_22150 [Streptomyces sp. S8]|uniref:hypothetical protein n=1 Tax=Streptomyces sp. S8 TaxID=1837283 RepID=UPI000A0919F5|nr:hypothetical protein [Streptomyces sp. S8]ARI54569.1 hypothetical protein A6E92_22150 [Streptomyces sp. S8]